MAVRSSRTAEPLTEAPRGAAMGTWGVWLTIIVLAMFVAGLATAALYLETGDTAWPPDDLEVPGRGWALLAVALTGAATAAMTWSLVRMKAGDRRGAALSLAGSGAVLTGGVIALVADLGAVSFRWDEHAYASVYWGLTGFTIAFGGVALLMMAAVLVQTVTGLVDEDRHLELTNATIYVWFVLGTSILLLGLVHLLPVAGGGP